MKRERFIKTGISVPADLLERIDAEAERRRCSRSAVIRTFAMSLPPVRGKRGRT